MSDNNQQSETSPEYITILARTFFAIQKQRIMATSQLRAKGRVNHTMLLRAIRPMNHMTCLR